MCMNRRKLKLSLTCSQHIKKKNQMDSVEIMILVISIRFVCSSIRWNSLWTWIEGFFFLLNHIYITNMMLRSFQVNKNGGQNVVTNLCQRKMLAVSEFPSNVKGSSCSTILFLLLFFNDHWDGVLKWNLFCHQNNVTVMSFRQHEG